MSRDAEDTAPLPIAGAAVKVKNVYAWRLKDGGFEVHKFYRGRPATATKPAVAPRWARIVDHDRSDDLTQDERMELRNELRQIRDHWNGLNAEAR